MKKDRGTLKAVKQSTDEQKANPEATIKDLEEKVRLAGSVLVAVRRNLSALVAEIDKVVM